MLTGVSGQAIRDDMCALAIEEAALNEWKGYGS